MNQWCTRNLKGEVYSPSSNCLSLIRMHALLIKDAYCVYYSIPVAPEHQGYTCISCFGEDVCCTSSHTTPTVLMSAPLKFTKLMKPALAYSLGLVNAIYIDDKHLQGRTREECPDTMTYLQLQQDPGFVINVGKSVIVPGQQITMLGCVLCSRSILVRLTEEKAEDIKNKCVHLWTKEDPAVQGKMCSSFSGVEYRQMHYRELEKLKIHSLKINRGNVDAVVSITDGTADDLLVEVRMNRPHSSSFHVDNLPMDNLPPHLMSSIIGQLMLQPFCYNR